MKLVNEIIELAVDDTVRLPVILRKCLVVATKLKNERLKQWVLGELKGYEDNDNLPQYRVLPITAKGYFLGPFQGELRDQPLSPGVLEEKHRVWATTHYLNAGISGYERILEQNAEGMTVISPWPADLVVAYQSKFFKGWVLNRAWQDLPVAALTALVDTVRTRLLEFALELQGEIGDSEEPLNQIPPEKIERAVTNIFFGGQNVFASDIAGNVQQVGELSVIKGDFDSLARVLNELGMPVEECAALKEAIAKDREAGEATGLGDRTSKWLGKALTYLGTAGGQITGDVAKTTLTKAVMAYLGLE